MRIEQFFLCHNLPSKPEDSEIRIQIKIENRYWSKMHVSWIPGENTADTIQLMKFYKNKEKIRRRKTRHSVQQWWEPQSYSMFIVYIQS